MSRGRGLATIGMFELEREYKKTMSSLMVHTKLLKKASSLDFLR